MYVGRDVCLAERDMLPRPRAGCGIPSLARSRVLSLAISRYIVHFFLGGGVSGVETRREVCFIVSSRLRDFNAREVHYFVYIRM